uniref:Aspartyl-tRNA synthetase n=1 Tax=Megaselia scalaris TaxID=36166 RepID=T1GY08_MEGSC
MVEETANVEQSKKAAKKEAAKAAKAAKKAEHKAASGKDENQNAQETSSEDVSAGKYGPFGMIQSREKLEERKFVKVIDLTNYVKGNETVWVRGRVHTSRAKGKQCFLILRQHCSTVQCLLSVNEQISKQMVKFAGNISKESIIDINAKVVPVPTKIESCTEQSLELSILEIYLI